MKNFKSEIQIGCGMRVLEEQKNIAVSLCIFSGEAELEL